MDLGGTAPVDEAVVGRELRWGEFTLTRRDSRVRENLAGERTPGSELSDAARRLTGAPLDRTTRSRCAPFIPPGHVTGAA